MFRRLNRLVYLIVNKDKHEVTTLNAVEMINKIPCLHSQFFQITPMDVYVQKEMSEYPSKSDSSHMDQFMTSGERQEGDEATKLSKMMMNLSADLDYLEIEQARDWIKDLNTEQIRKNKQSLDLLQRFVKQTLHEQQYEEYVQKSAEELIEQLMEAQLKLDSKIM